MRILETNKRSLLKSLSYRFLGATVAALIALLLTGEISLAATFAALDFVVKICAYYIHERLWDRIDYGRVNATDYEI
jgi:uncharacterized membrane protein